MRSLARVFLFAVACVAMLGATAVARSKPAKQPSRNTIQSISGASSSAQHCLGNTSTATGVHVIGAVPNGSRITTTFASDFDPVASLVLVQMGLNAPEERARVAFTFDDDSGGNLEPELRVTTTFDSMAVLYVSRFDAGNNSACYFYKTEVQTP